MGSSLVLFAKLGHSHEVDRVAVQPVGTGKRKHYVYDRPHVMTIGEFLEIA
jgi:hypothetical protein